MNDFDTALDNFIANVNVKKSAYSHIETIVGKRYVKLVSVDNNGHGRSAYAFVDTDGLVYKPAGWNAPAKHARASIYDKSTWISAGQFSMAYLR